MTTQVISITPTGEVSGLQAKPGKGFDLRSLGNATIERASEVLFSEDNQQWYVKIMKGKYAGKVISHPMLSAARNTSCTFKGADMTAYFDEYDDAVQAEIAVLDHIRLREGPTALA